jgi:hypothetical protein
MRVQQFKNMPESADNKIENTGDKVREEHAADEIALIAARAQGGSLAQIWQEVLLAGLQSVASDRSSSSRDPTHSDLRSSKILFYKIKLLKNFLLTLHFDDPRGAGKRSPSTRRV